MVGNDDGRSEGEGVSGNGCDRVGHGRLDRIVGQRGIESGDEAEVNGYDYDCDCGCQRDEWGCGHVDQGREWWRGSESKIDLEEDVTRVVGLRRYPCSPEWCGVH